MTTWTRHEFVIDNWRPPTLNDLMRRTIHARIRLEKSCKQIVGVYFFKSGIPKASGSRRVGLHIVLGPRQQPCDVDAPWKALLDALKDCGAILGDTAALCRTDHPTFTRGLRASTTIILEDLEGE